jgi:hypothetical protein
MSTYYGPVHDFEPRQEEDLVPSGPVVRTSIVSVLVGAVGVFFAGVLVVAATGDIAPRVVGPGGTQPAPRQIGEIEQTQIWRSQRGIELRDAQRRELESWGWADREHHVARIPIDDAMTLVVEQAAAGANRPGGGAPR